MAKQTLSIEQMQHLQELGIDTSNASMVNCCIRDGYEYKHFLIESKYRFYKGNAIAFPTKNSVDYCKSVTPAYTLQDVLELLPKEIKPAEKCYWLRIDLADECIYYYRDAIDLTERRGKVFSYYGEELIDAAYNALCWCIENGYVETNKTNEV